MPPSTVERFFAQVTQRLRLLDDRIVPVLNAFINERYPAEVVSLDFEVFTDGFTDSFPVRAFFLDADRCEFFAYVDGEARYPTSLEPDVLQLPEGVYDPSFEEPFVAEDSNLDTFTVAGEALVEWFAIRWQEAGGSHFSRRATIALHDDARVFDLMEQKWREPA